MEEEGGGGWGANDVAEKRKSSALRGERGRHFGDGGALLPQNRLI